MEAFHYAWMCGLQEPAITAENVAAAPRQLLRAIFMTAEQTQKVWANAVEQIQAFREAVPTSTAVN